jgi:hypothetical protein
MTRWLVAAGFLTVAVLSALAMSLTRRGTDPERLRSWLSGRMAILGVASLVAGLSVLVKGIPAR